MLMPICVLVHALSAPPTSTHAGITLTEFKRIFYWEYSHRMLGRVLGLVYGVPALVLLTRSHVPRALKGTLAGILGLIGVQGALGWYMVQSGLVLVPEADSVPRVSQYRLAAHLGVALVIFTLMMSSSLKLLLAPAKVCVLVSLYLSHSLTLSACAFFLFSLQWIRLQTHGPCS